MSETGQNPKPLTEDQERLWRMLVVDATYDCQPPLELSTSDVAQFLATLDQARATITTLRASLGEAEKRAEEATDVIREVSAALGREIGDERTCAEWIKASEGLVAVLREALETIVARGQHLFTCGGSPCDCHMAIVRAALAAPTVNNGAVQ